MASLLLPSRAMLKPDRPVIHPGWDESPPWRRRRRDWWPDLLSGRAALNMKPGCCCSPPCSTCVPTTNLKISWTATGACASNAGPFTMIYDSINHNWTYNFSPVGACGTVLAKLYCGTGDLVGLHFCDTVPLLGQLCCDSGTNVGVLNLTSITCGTPFLATFAFDASKIGSSGGGCDQLYNTDGYRTFTVSS